MRKIFGPPPSTFMAEKNVKINKYCDFWPSYINLRFNKSENKDWIELKNNLNV